MTPMMNGMLSTLLLCVALQVAMSAGKRDASQGGLLLWALALAIGIGATATARFL